MLVSNSLINVTFKVCNAVNPVTEPAGLHVAFHVKFPPVTSVNNTALNIVPEQIGAGGVFIRCGVGFTVTEKSVGVPVHPLAWGVTL